MFIKGHEAAAGTEEKVNNQNGGELKAGDEKDR